MHEEVEFVLGGEVLVGRVVGIVDGDVVGAAGDVANACCLPEITLLTGIIVDTGQ